MKQINIQANGRMATLGRLSQSTQQLLRMNGTDSADGYLAPQIANQNSEPLASSGTGMLGATRIATPAGPVMIEELSVGDHVVTASGQTATIRHILKTAISKTAISLRAPYFGLDQDLVVGEDHRIAVTSDVAEYLFGAETVLVPAWALKDNTKARHWELDRNTCLYQLQLDTADAVKVGRCAVESMPKSGQSIGKVLNEEEARCFAAEHRSGYHN